MLRDPYGDGVAHALMFDDPDDLILRVDPEELPALCNDPRFAGPRYCPDRLATDQGDQSTYWRKISELVE